MATYSLVVVSYRVEKSVAKTRERAIESLYERLDSGETIMASEDSSKALLSVLERLTKKERGENER